MVDGESNRFEKFRFFWLTYPHSLCVASTFYIAYSIYILVTSVMLFHRRHHYLLRKSMTVMSIASAFLQFSLISVHFYRFLLMQQMSPALLIWRNYVFFPLTIMLNLVTRGMHICFEVFWMRFLTAHYVDSGTFVPPESISKGFLNKPIHKVTEETMCDLAKYGGGNLEATRSMGHMEAIQRSAAKSSEERKTEVIVFLKRRFTLILSSVLVSIHILVAILLHIFYVRILNEKHLLNGKFNAPPSISPFVELSGIIFAVAVYGILWCPLMLCYLRGEHDAYGLRQDLKTSLAYGVPLYLLYTAFRCYRSLKSLFPDLPAFILMMAAMIVLHTATVTAPLLRTFGHLQGTMLLGVEKPLEEKCCPLAGEGKVGNGTWKSDGVNEIEANKMSTFDRFEVRTKFADASKIHCKVQKISTVKNQRIATRLLSFIGFDGIILHPSIDDGLFIESKEDIPRKIDQRQIVNNRTSVPEMDLIGFVNNDGDPVILHHRPVPIVHVLGNAELALPFEDYTRRAFVWESILFYRTVCTYRQEWDERRSLTIALEIYNRFVRPNAPFEMNLTHGVRVKIKRFLFNRHSSENYSESDLENGEVVPISLETLIIDSNVNHHDMSNRSLTEIIHVFDEAVEEVLCNISQCTYRNFLHSIQDQPTLKARYLIPHGHFSR